MCWETRKYTKNGKVRTAEHDIPVYKVINKTRDGKLLSYYKAFPYAEYATPPKAELEGYRINRGRMEYGKCREEDIFESVLTGYHSYSCENTLFTKSKTAITWRTEPKKPLYFRLMPVSNFFRMRINRKNDSDFYVYGVDPDGFRDPMAAGYKSLALYCFTRSEGLGILFCTIPAGAKYFLNERGEYVSDMIRTGKAYSVPSWFGAMAVNARMLYYHLRKRLNSRWKEK